MPRRKHRSELTRLALGVAAARLMTAGLLALGVAAASARAAELPLWEAGAGVAVINFPDYRGSDQRRNWLLPFPYVVYRGEFLRVDEHGMRGLLFESDRVDLNISVNGAIPVDSDDNDARRGMPDLDPTLEIGPTLNFALWRSTNARRKLELRLPLRAVIATDLPHASHEGWLFLPNVNIGVEDFMGNAGWKFGLMGGPIFSDRRYNRYFYAVDPAFATASRPAYTPREGYAGAQLVAGLSKRYRNFWIGGFARWDTLRDAAFEDSPLVKDRRYFAAGFAIAWILGESRTTVAAGRK